MKNTNRIDRAYIALAKIRELVSEMYEDLSGTLDDFDTTSYAGDLDESINTISRALSRIED